jgi:RNA-directed DNA polymerase
LSEPLQKKPKSQMSDEERVREFQRKLYLKAKQEKEFRFYVLYDKVRLPYVLREAYKRCKANGGRAGIDGITFDHIEKGGVPGFIEGIKQELEERRYKASPVIRVYIPKANGKMRPLGIPTIKDRVVQTACKMVIEPIFEADFEESSYGFRPERSASQAVERIKDNLKKGNTELYDADLSSYFDTIPHSELMYLIGIRISDRNVLHLIKMWLKAPIYEEGRMSGGKKNKKGTPQGGVISPLLANIYLNLVDKAVKRTGGVFQKAGIEIVRYADDFILMGRSITRKVIMYLYGMMERMKLKINEDKSRTMQAKEEAVDFLGFTFRYDRDLNGRRARYWNVCPSKKSEKKIREKLREKLKSSGHLPPEKLVDQLNPVIRGWLNYFMIPKVSYIQKAKRNLRYYLMEKICRYYRRKSQRKSKLYCQGAYKILVEKYDLIDPWYYSGQKALVNAFR